MPLLFRPVRQFGPVCDLMRNAQKPLPDGIRLGRDPHLMRNFLGQVDGDRPHGRHKVMDSFGVESVSDLLAESGVPMSHFPKIQG